MSASPNRLQTLLLCLGGLLIFAYVATFSIRDWIPHDEGLLGLTARQAAQGKLPHRDFEDPYTGGLAFWHAGSFALLGENVLATRLTLVAASAAFFAAIYATARHAVGPWAALGATALAAAWSLPNYFAALPSWYNTFLATFGVLALLRFRVTGASRWLLAAGLCAGLSMLVKIVGLYFLAAALLFLAFVEQQRPAARRRELFASEAPGAGMQEGQAPINSSASAARSWPLLAIKVVGAALFTLLLIALVRRHARPPEIVHFILPGAALAWLLVVLEARDGGGATRERLAWLATRIGTLMLGAAIPLLCFAAPYLASGSLDDLIHGVFVAPQARIGAVSMPLPPTITLAAGLPLAVLLAVSLRPGSRSRSLDLGLAIAVGAAFLLTLPFCGPSGIADGRELNAYEAIWLTVRPATPIVALFACAALILPYDVFSSEKSRQEISSHEKSSDVKTRSKAKKTAKITEVKREVNRTSETANGELDASARRCDLYLLAAVAALTSLVQYPYSAAIYFCYVAPLTILAATFFVRWTAGAPRVAATTLGVGLTVFAVLWMNSRPRKVLADGRLASSEVALLELPAGMIYVPLPDKAVYEAIAALVAETTPVGEPIWAGPDCPEVPFLCERENAAAALYDVLATTNGEASEKPDNPAERLAKLLDERKVKIAVVNVHPEFSPPLSEESIAVLNERFPNSAPLGRFRVFVRE